MPLEGIRVLDMTTGQQGPVAAQYLGDMGADVIKIEDPVRGDFNRGLARSLGVSAVLPHGRTVPMEAHNRNKRGLAADLKTEEGKRIVYDLVERSDIFLQNYRPGVAARLGMDYESLRKHNPRLIYGSANSFGQNGPDAEIAGNDLVATARSGLLFQIGDPASPAPIADTLADRAGAIFLAYGLVLAIVARERLGIGQEVHNSLLGSLIHLQGRNLATTLLQGHSLHNVPRTKRGPFWNLYLCKDGRWLTISHTKEPDRYWPRFCDALGLPELGRNPQYATVLQREEQAETLIPIFDGVFATKTYEEWADILREKVGDFIFNYASRVIDLAADPQVVANEYIVDFEHPVLGTIKMEGVAATLSETPGAIRYPAPELGEHTEEILVELGRSWDEILRLKELNIIR